LILVNIPAVSRKGIAYDPKKAAALEQKGVIINWIDRDYGPITKLFGTLEFIEKQGLQDVRIILVDDDVQYDTSIFGKLIDSHEVAAGFVSRDAIIEWGRIKDTLWIPTGPQQPTAILETYAGVIYSADLFLPFAVLRDWYLSLPDFCHNADDLVIAAWVQRRGTSLIKLQNETEALSHDAGQTPQLNQVNLIGNNTKVLQYFFDHFYFLQWQTILTILMAILISYGWLLGLVVCIALVVAYAKKLNYRALTGKP